MKGIAAVGRGTDEHRTLQHFSLEFSCPNLWRTAANLIIKEHIFVVAVA